jgi:predicted RNA-binding Zn-ribbon protein involved in translation (DUF1610 family)
MNSPPHEFSADPPDTERRKTVLFCQTCGRAANIGDWPTELADGRVVSLDCPDCGTTVWRGLASHDTEPSTRVPTPTP